MRIDRNQMKTGALAVLALAGATVGLTPAALAQAAGTTESVAIAQPETAPSTAAGALKYAATLADQGQLVRARALVEKIVRSELASTGSEREQAMTLLRSIDDRIGRADPSRISLQKAEAAVTEGDLRTAERQARAVISRQSTGDAERGAALRVLEQVSQRRDEIRPLIPGLVEQAGQDFNARQYGAAKAALLTVLRSGIELSPEVAQQLERYQLQIVDMEKSSGQAFAVSDDASMGMMQPGQVRRKKPAGGDPAPSEPAPAPAPADSPKPAIDMPAEQPPANTPPPPPPPAAEPAASTPPPAPAAPPAQDLPQDQLIQAAMRAEGQRILAEADHAFASQRFDVARDKYRVALSSFRSYLSSEEINRAEQQAAEARMKLQTNVPGSDLSGPGIQSAELIRQRTTAEFNNYMEQAQQRLDAGDPQRAQELVAQASLASKASNSYFNQAELDAMQSRVNDLNLKISAKRDEITIAERERREKDQVAAAAQSEKDRALERQRRISERIDRIRALQSEQKYDEALQVTDEVLFLDPNNPTALLLRDIISDIRVYVKYNEVARRKQLQAVKLTLDNEESSIAPTGVMDYPAEWPAKTFERGETAAYNEPVENRRVLAELEKKRVPADFADNKFEDVLTYVKTLTQVNMDVDWESLESVNVNKDTLVTLKLSPLPATTLLDRVLNKVSSDPFAKAGWTVRDGILTVASDEALRKDKTLVIYNIQDLLFDIPNHTEVPEIDLNSVLQQSQGGQGQSPFRDDQQDENANRPTRDELQRAIIDIIQANVDPEGWRDTGGETGAIQTLNGSLIITNTPKNHREIVGLLSKLREIRNMQINVETKFLLVNQNWFEQIGFDLDIVFNANNNQVRAARGADPSVQPSDFFDGTVEGGSPQGLVRTITGFGPTAPGQLGPIGNAQRINQAVVNPRGWSPIGAGQNSLGLTNSLAEGDFASAILGLSPALGIAGQFLDDIQVDFLIQATQADKRTVQLTAPRLTFTNGQTANIYVVTQQAFVSDLTPVTGDSAVGFDPTVGVASEGVTLLVEGVISADRRYVTMNVDAGVARIDGFGREAVTAVAGGQLVSSEQVQSFIQLPTITVTRVRTTATVPDEGTVLLGGQRLITEVEVETGVPVLSKLPIINRFFTNRLESKEEQTLLILLKPTIMIQSEEEERQFPGLLDQVRSGLGSR